MYGLLRAVTLGLTVAMTATAGSEDIANPLKALWKDDALVNVPEPASYVLLGSGLVVLSLVGRARHRRR